MSRIRISREEAIEQGLKRYYTSAPCKRGHDCDRYVLNGGCVQCVNEAVYARRDEIHRKRREVAVRDAAKADGG